MSYQIDRTPKMTLTWVGEALASPGRTAVPAVLNLTGGTPVLPEGRLKHALSPSKGRPYPKG
jgi:hypothetical protein